MYGKRERSKGKLSSSPFHLPYFCKNSILNFSVIIAHKILFYAKFNQTKLRETTLCTFNPLSDIFYDWQIPYLTYFYLFLTDNLTDKNIYLKTDARLLANYKNIAEFAYFFQLKLFGLVNY
jgi:hypothetical protein